MASEQVKYRAPVEGELSFGKKLDACFAYFSPLVSEAYVRGNTELLRSIGVCPDFRGAGTLNLAVNPDSGETISEYTGNILSPTFKDFVAFLQGLDPEATVAQAATILVSLPSVFEPIKDELPIGFEKSKILRFPIPDLSLFQEIRRAL